jgi:hypothetical protein
VVEVICGKAISRSIKSVCGSARSHEDTPIIVSTFISSIKISGAFMIALKKIVK